MTDEKLFHLNSQHQCLCHILGMIVTLLASKSNAGTVADVSEDYVVSAMSLGRYTTVGLRCPKASRDQHLSLISGENRACNLRVAFATTAKYDCCYRKSLDCL